jgi:Mycobacterium membrane protein
LANRDLTRPRAAACDNPHTNNICTISTMNYLDSDIQDYPDDDVDDIYADDDDVIAPIDERWRPVAVIAGIVFVLAVIATVVIVNGGDSASTSATVVVPPSRSVTSPRLGAPPVPSLPRETVTTVTPAPRKPSPTPTAGPTNAPTVIPPPVAVPSVPPDVAARTFVYRVTGTKGLLDLVTVVYTDAQGAPQTDFNVSLPWSRTVVMNPGVQLRSIVATSLTGHLNCSITDGAGQPVAMSTSNAMIATCTR